MTAIRTEQLPPNAIEIEEAVLGAMLLNSQNCDEAIELLTPESFYKIEHFHIFQSILDVRKESKIVDIMTVAHDLKKKQLLKMIGAGFISKLTNKVSSAAHVEKHAFILKEYETARKYLSLGYRFIDQAQSPSFDLFKMNNFAADEVQKIMNVASVKKVIDNLELAQELKRNIEMADQMQGVTGVPTGFSEYDRLTGGHKRTNFIVMAARPGMGKTALALCMMLNAVVNFGKKVMFFTREMPAIELFQRLCCIHMNIDSDRFKRGNLDQKEWDHFNSNLQALLSKDIVIVDDCKTMQEIHLRAKKERMKGEVHEIIIDYLQLVNGPEKKREELISAVSRACKEMATDLDLPVIALSQLNRSVETRGGDKRPQLSDLRESGAIEQDADMVIFVYRPPYYGDTSHGDNAAFICIAKHRNGKLQDVPLKFIPQLTKFVDTDQIAIPF